MQNDNPELFQYYYHSDHVGSTSLITNLDGEVVQHVEYVPFGEVFIEERNNTWNTPYLFNAKELDEETGLYYYGARYYEPRVSIWLSTDPLQEKYPNISTYAYCVQNPVNAIDPDGCEWKDTKDKEIAKGLQQQATDRDNSLVKQETKINAKIEKIGQNAKLSTEKKTKRIEKQQVKLRDVQEQRTILSNFKEGITQLGNSETVYTFNTVKQGTTATLSSMENGTIVINNYGTVGNRAHETTHAIQHENGKISFNPIGSNKTRMQNPYLLEIQAYRTEYSITGGTVPSSDARFPLTVFGINDLWLLGVKDPNTGTYPYRPENYK